MALGERVLAARFGDDLVDHRTWVFCGDGDLMEGVSHEAASLAGHLGLSKLIVLYDDNQVSIDGPTSLSFSEDVLARFAAYGWATGRADGLNQASVAEAVKAALATGKPTIIACRTVIGFGAPTKAGTSGAHGAPLGAKEIEGARKALNWPYPPFEIPDAIRAAWAAVGGARQAGPRCMECAAGQERGARDLRLDAGEGNSGARRDHRGDQAGSRRRQAEARHPCRFRQGAGEAGAAVAGSPRRFGRSQPVEQYAREGDGGHRPPARSPEPTSTMAFASSPWPRR